MCRPAGRSDCARMLPRQNKAGIPVPLLLAPHIDLANDLIGFLYDTHRWRGHSLSRLRRHGSQTRARSVASLSLLDHRRQRLHALLLRVVDVSRCFDEKIVDRPSKRNPASLEFSVWRAKTLPRDVLPPTRALCRWRSYRPTPDHPCDLPRTRAHDPRRSCASRPARFGRPCVQFRAVCLRPSKRSHGSTFYDPQPF